MSGWAIWFISSKVMRKFNEALLQFIWQHKLWQPTALQTFSGKVLRVLNTGVLNYTNGPDFFNAALIIDDIHLHGNVEVHLKTSDWLKHQHQNDERYNKLILHVVYEHDIELEQNKNFEVEVLELKHYLSTETIDKYNELMHNKKVLACTNQISKIANEKINIWLQRMVSERLEQKSEYVNQLYAYFNTDYQQTFYTLFLRAFGFKSNSEVFELLAKHLPLKVISQHKQNPFQLEALLLGMCGLLDEIFTHPYGTILQNEFAALQKKYNLVPLPKSLLTTGGVRPANAPSLRLAQLAAFINQNFDLFESPFELKNYSVLLTDKNVQASSFWESHYNLTKKSQAHVSTNLARGSKDSLIINAAAPFLFFYGKLQQDESICEKAIELLDKCTFEKNRKTQVFLNENLKFNSASQSQGLIHLHDKFCQKKACLNCAIGLNILQKEVYLNE
jgi:hypothetical protein